MFNDKVTRAIAERGLSSLHIIEVPHQPEPVGPEAQRLNRLGRTYKDRGNMLDTRASIEHGHMRGAQLYREAKVCHDLAERYFEEAKVLSHYGAKGMKWGIRRTKQQRAAAKAKRTVKKNKKIAAKAKKAEDKANLIKTKASATKAKAQADQAKAVASKATSEAKVAEAKAKRIKTKTNKKTKKLSDAELKTAVLRLEMEKKYNKLNSEKKSTTRMQRGKSEMSKLAKQSASTAVQSHTTNIMKQALTVGIQKSSPRLKNYKPPKSAKL